MPDYVCPECWEAIVRRAVLVKGTLIHVDCYLRTPEGAAAFRARRKAKAHAG